LDRTVYVIGHKNPDTDSVVAAAAYAGLKRAQGMDHVHAARAGAVNPQTEYIFERFGVALPEFVPDLIPKVEYWLGGPAVTVRDRTPLWEALQVMGKSELKALPIVDAEGKYVSMLHYGAFAQNILTKINPHKKAVIPTSVGHLASIIKAQTILAFDEDQFFKARIVVGALETGSFRNHLEQEPASNKVVLVGDREDIQRIAIEAGVRVLIITNGNLIGKGLRELAEQKKVSVLVSPYDTSSTALLAIYSTPVGTMGDAGLKAVHRSDWIKTARTALAASPSRSVPVLDDDLKVVGLFSEGDLLRDPNVEVIMVDHNEFSQAVEGIENYRVLEVLDHHRLGSFSTKYPITFINRVVGSTSTIVAGMYREQHVPLPVGIAAILLCGILSDTLILHSATTTEQDREMAEYLANLCDLEIEVLGREILASASAVASKPAAEIIKLDLKEYEATGKRISVSQVEVADTSEIMERRAEIMDGLKKLRKEGGYYLSAIMVTDITDLTSLLLIDADKDFLSLVNYPKEESGVYVLKDILSRKKQLMPALFELVEKAMEG
jgi:manganese-dependent inorganic pyrophosphatase